MSETLRLTKYLTTTSQYSRREAENLVIDGWVSVNGQVVDRPQHMVNPQLDHILVSQNASLTPSAPVTFLVYKPSNLSPNNLNPDMLSNGDSHFNGNDSSVLSVANLAKKLLTPEQHMPYDRSTLTLQHKYLRQLDSIYPLENHASGLLIFTQDISLVKRLSQVQRYAEQEYVVGVDGTILADGLALLNHPHYAKTHNLVNLKVSWQNEKHLRIAGKGLQLGDIARIGSTVGLSVNSIKRQRIGRVSLANLKVGQWRFMLTHEKI